MSISTEPQSIEYPIVPAPIPEPQKVIAPGAVAPAKVPTAPPLRLLPQIAERETQTRQWIFIILALLITAAYWFFLQSFWAPAPSRPGIDENAYLLGGKMMALHGSPGFKPTDDFQFVDVMWIRAKDGWYYPKYPAGLPLLDAIAIRLGGAAHGIDWAFEVSPVCMTLAVLGMFFLTRNLAGSFCGILGMILLATGSISLELAEIPNSHAPDLCVVVWGMFFLIRWWQSGATWRGILAGVLLGYAVTLRYSEALLLFPLYPLDQVLADTWLKTEFAAHHPHWWSILKMLRFLPIGPLGLAVLLSIRWKNWRSHVRAAVPIISWGVPVIALVALNWFTLGTMTGYDVTNESSGFTTAEFLQKWDFTIHEVYLFGLFIFAPLGFAGLMMLFQKNWRMALLLVLWLVPGWLLYTAYYWGESLQGVGFLRFFLTLFPPLIMAGLWLIHKAGEAPFLTLPRSIKGGNKKEIAWPIAAGILTAASASISLWAALPEMERQHRGNLNLQYDAMNIRRQLKAPTAKHSRAVAFADSGMLPQLLQYVQFSIDADWYTEDSFEPRMMGGFGLSGIFQGNDPTAPVLIQRQRIDYMTQLLKNKKPADLVNDAHKLFDATLSAGRPIYAILTPAQERTFRNEFISKEYEMRLLDHWVEPCLIKPPFPTNPRAAVPGTQSPLIAPSFSGSPVIRWDPEALSMYELSRH